MKFPAVIKTKNVLLDSIADGYLEESLREIDEGKIKESLRGRFSNIRYTAGGYDISALSRDEKIELIQLIYSIYLLEFNFKTASTRLESLITRLKDRFGSEKELEGLLLKLPDGIFDEERLKKMNKEELEEKVTYYIKQLDDMRSNFEKNLALRTVKLGAEKDILATTLGSISDGVITLNKHGEIVAFNRSMEELTGFLFSEIEGKKSDDVIRLFENSVPLEFGAYCPNYKAMEDKDVYTNDKLTLITRNGQKKYIRMTSSSIPNGKEVDIGCIVTITDITGEIELEKMKLDFVSIAAHELRTPLTSIRGYLSLLSDELKGTISKVHEEYLTKIVVSSNYLYTLVENLLNISRIERGSLVLNKEKVEWLPFVKGVIEDFQQNAKTANIELVVSDSGFNNQFAYVDKAMVSEVLSNLLDNSIKYNKEGGRVSVFFEVSENFITTHLKDTGLGIPKESTIHIFKKFYRVSGVLKQGIKGTGLGLFISSEIIKMHGGRIWMESEFGEGSTFSFTVPMYMEEK